MSQIFLVYTALNQKPVDLSGPDGFRGLGHMNSRKDILSIQFELTAPSPSLSKLAEDNSVAKSRKGKSTTRTRGSDKGPHIIEIELAQDKTALRSRKGDTGSVLWRAR